MKLFITTFFYFLLIVFCLNNPPEKEYTSAENSYQENSFNENIHVVKEHLSINQIENFKRLIEIKPTNQNEKISKMY